MSSNRTFDFSNQKDFFKKFLTDFPAGSPAKRYLPQLKKIELRQQIELQVYLDDIEQYEGTDKIVSEIESNTLRFVAICNEAIDDLIPPLSSAAAGYDVLDVLSQQNRETSIGNNQKDGKPKKILGDTAYPKELSRRHELRFIPRAARREKPIPLREVKAGFLGRLLTVKGIVIRVTDVKPQVVIATYICNKCAVEIFQPVVSKSYMPLLSCLSKACSTGVTPPGRLEMQTRGSKFIKFQEIRIQELSDQVPIGHIPRALTIHVHGELTRRCSPGDIVDIDGIFLPVANEGFKAMRIGMVASTYILGLAVEQQKKRYSDYEPTPEIQTQIQNLDHTRDVYGQLASSIAPQIYGHNDVKKALLLQMVGGVTRQMADGMKIRGDINVCLMGDPGVAKSQLLKHISVVAPRGVYTSGKGSSGVGLTAAVVQDPNTKELTLEGGSLVLADMGICCIDEFDKMEESDRTAIHEVMEQQTISIAKAGITTTLNARTSILAAANPAYSRYNPKKSPTENINLPAALLSRFDLLFLLLDRADSVKDRELAEHVTYVHRYSKHPETQHKAFPAEFLRAYVSLAKAVQPVIPPSLRAFIVDSYISMRQRDYGDANREDTDAFGYTTARTLLGILRLSQAMARIRFSEEVMQGDVEEAMRLMHQCQEQLKHTKDMEKSTAAMDPITDIFHIIRAQSLKDNNPTVRYETILPQVLAKHSQQLLDQALQSYEQLDVWIVDSAKTKIVFVNR